MKYSLLQGWGKRVYENLSIERRTVKHHGQAGILSFAAKRIVCRTPDAETRTISAQIIAEGAIAKRKHSAKLLPSSERGIVHDRANRYDQARIRMTFFEGMIFRSFTWIRLSRVSIQQGVFHCILLSGKMLAIRPSALLPTGSLPGAVDLSTDLITRWASSSSSQDSW